MVDDDAVALQALAGTVPPRRCACRLSCAGSPDDHGRGRRDPCLLAASAARQPKIVACSLSVGR